MNEWLAGSNRIQPNGAALLALRVSPLQPNAAVDVTTIRFLGAVRHAFLLFLCEESEARSCLVSSASSAAAAAMLAMINTVTIL